MKHKVVLLVGLVLALTMITLPLLAQDNHHHSGEGNQTPIVQSAENDRVKLTVSLNPGVSIVGHPTEITGQIVDKATGRPVRNSLVKLNAHHIEDDKTMMHTEFVAAEGSFSFDNHFFDGAKHNLTISIESTDASAIKFEAVGITIPVEVVGVQPPTDVKVKTIIFLLIVMALGMVLGVVTAKSLKFRRSKRLSAAVNLN